MDIRIKEWEKLIFHDPSVVLPNLKKAQIDLSSSDADLKLKELRTNLLKKYLEKRTAAIFCYGVSQLIKRKVFVAFPKEQNSIYDAIGLYIDDDSANFAPIQIKEIVPKRINKDADLNNELKKISKKNYDSKETVLVIQDNQKKDFNIKEVIVPSLRFKELWIVGCCDPEQKIWWLAGDMLSKNRQIHEFPYPRK